MMGVSPRDDDARRQQVVETYVRALDHGDFDTVAAVLADAVADPDLDRLLVEVDAELQKEAGLPTPVERARTVRGLLLRHLSSAFPEAQSGPLRVGDVAARLKADHAAGRHLLLQADHAANEQLLTNRTTLDGPMTARTIRAVAAGLPIQASDRFWELFRRAGLALVMARTTGSSHLAAAREREPEPPARRVAAAPPPPPESEPGTADS
jgi:hypothetical protein